MEDLPILQEVQQLADFFALIAMLDNGAYPLDPLIAIAERSEARQARRDEP